MTDFSDATPLIDFGTIGRLLTYLAVAALIGAWTTAVWLAPRAARRRSGMDWSALLQRAWRIGGAAAWVLLVGTLLRGAAQLLLLRDPEEAMTMDWMTSVVTGTVWGRGWLVQFVVALLVLVTWRQPQLPAWGSRAAALVTVLAAAVADAFTGHGMAGEWAGGIGVTLHAVHLSGVGLWLGTLGVVVAALRGSDALVRRQMTVVLFGAVTPAALIGGGVVTGAGVLMAVEYAGGWSVLLGLEDIYARTIAVKTGLVAAILALGGWHWRRAVPAMARQQSDGGALRWTVLAELLLAGLVIGLSAVLVSLPAAGV